MKCILEIKEHEYFVKFEISGEHDKRFETVPSSVPFKLSQNKTLLMLADFTIYPKTSLSTFKWPASLNGRTNFFFDREWKYSKCDFAES